MKTFLVLAAGVLLASACAERRPYRETFGPPGPPPEPPAVGLRPDVDPNFLWFGGYGEARDSEYSSRGWASRGLKP